MLRHKVVSSAEWLNARKDLLEKEKEFTRLREELTESRRNLPWEKVEKDYQFEGPNGKESLSDLFEGRSQLIIYHFMFDPEWEEGCKSCSLIADHYNPLLIHLQHRDVTMVTVSRAPLKQLQAFKQRMGWNFKWVSSAGSDFNFDNQVSSTKEQLEQPEVYYNYKMQSFPSAERPGMSVFCKDESGEIFHTYSAFSRGLEIFLGIYNFLDIVPKGRDESALTYGMEWVRHHDKYDDSKFVDPYISVIMETRKRSGS
jgi:predicted dithiol-disulfide oxidoreductase (DUF899 family)